MPRYAMFYEKFVIFCQVGERGFFRINSIMFAVFFMTKKLRGEIVILTSHTCGMPKPCDSG